MVSLEFLFDIILSAALWSWGRLSLWRKLIKGMFPGVKAAGVYGRHPYHLHGRLSGNLGASTPWNPTGLSTPVRGLLYLYYIYTKLTASLSFFILHSAFTNWSKPWRFLLVFRRCLVLFFVRRPTPDQARINGRANRAALWGANLLGVLRRHCSNLRYGSSKLRFAHAKEFLRKLSAVWARTVKIFRQPWPKPKKFRNICLKGRPHASNRLWSWRVFVLVSIDILKLRTLAHFPFWTKEKRTGF
jgi:hypothetical protein